MDGLIAEDILELLSDSDHFILPHEGEDHRKAAIEEEPFHDDVIADQILEELLRPLKGLCGEIGSEDVFGELHLKLIFGVDRVDLVIHVEDFAVIEGERFDNVEKGVSVDRLLKSLAQEILARFWIGDVAENGEDNVVADEALRCGEKSEVAHDDAPLIGGEFV